MGEKHVVRFEPVGVEIEVDEEQTVLRAAAEQGITLMHGCKEGQCASCKSFVLDGDDIELDKYSTFALPDFELEEGFTLLCRAHVYEDVTIERCRVDGVVAALGRAGHPAGPAGARRDGHGPLGPLALGWIDYHVSSGAADQLRGGDVAGLVLVGPVALAAAWRVATGRPGADALALAPASYGLYSPRLPAQCLVRWRVRSQRRDQWPGRWRSSWWSWSM